MCFKGSDYLQNIELFLKFPHTFAVFPLSLNISGSININFMRLGAVYEHNQVESVTQLNFTLTFWFLCLLLGELL